MRSLTSSSCPSNEWFGSRGCKVALLQSCKLQYNIFEIQAHCSGAYLSWHCANLKKKNSYRGQNGGSDRLTMCQTRHRKIAVSWFLDKRSMRLEEETNSCPGGRGIDMCSGFHNTHSSPSALWGSLPSSIPPTPWRLRWALVTAEGRE